MLNTNSEMKSYFSKHKIISSPRHNDSLQVFNVRKFTWKINVYLTKMLIIQHKNSGIIIPICF
jgi:hypothetical protein